MIFVFVCDTREQLSQATASGLRLIDVLKSAIEHFVKMRVPPTPIALPPPNTPTASAATTAATAAASTAAAAAAPASSSAAAAAAAAGASASGAVPPHLQSLLPPVTFPPTPTAQSSASAGGAAAAAVPPPPPRDTFLLVTCDADADADTDTDTATATATPPAAATSGTAASTTAATASVRRLHARARVGWRDSMPSFMRTVKYLNPATARHSLQCVSLAAALTILNRARALTVDAQIGQGLRVWETECAVVIVLADASHDITLPAQPTPPASNSVAAAVRQLNAAAGTATAAASTSGTNLLSADERTLCLRWDQRLFAALLRFPAATPHAPSTPTTSLSPTAKGGSSVVLMEDEKQPAAAAPNPLNSSSATGAAAPATAAAAAAVAPPPSSMEERLSEWCDRSGGKCDVLRTVPTLLRFMDHIASRSHPSVVVRLSFGGLTSPATIWVRHSTAPAAAGAAGTGANVGAGPNGGATGAQPQSALALQLQQMQAQLQSCRWPIPESYLPQSTLASLPVDGQRCVAPTIVVGPEAPVRARLIEGFAVDWHDLDPSAFSPALLSQLLPAPHEPNAHYNSEEYCRPVYVFDSLGDGTLGRPFGFIQPSRVRTRLKLYVCPYNYPRLWALLEELVATHAMAPDDDWHTALNSYLDSVPPYYIPPLKLALRRFGLVTVRLLDPNPPLVWSPAIESALRSHKLAALTALEAEHKQQLSSPASPASPSLSPYLGSGAPKSPSLSPLSLSPRSPSPQSPQSPRQLKLGDAATATPLISSSVAAAAAVAEPITHPRLLRPRSYSTTYLSRRLETELIALAATGDSKSDTMSDAAGTTTASAPTGASLYPNPLTPQSALAAAAAAASEARLLGAASADEVLRQLSSEQSAEELKHTVPISEMGNYFPVLMAQPVWRDPLLDESSPDACAAADAADPQRRFRIHFGSPFRKQQSPQQQQQAANRARFAADEVDEGIGGAKRGRKLQKLSTRNGPRPSFQEFISRGMHRKQRVHHSTSGGGGGGDGGGKRLRLTDVTSNTSSTVNSFYGSDESGDENESEADAEQSEPPVVFEPKLSVASAEWKLLRKRFWCQSVVTSLMTFVIPLFRSSPAAAAASAIAIASASGAGSAAVKRSRTTDHDITELLRRRLRPIQGDIRFRIELLNALFAHAQSYRHHSAARALSAMLHTAQQQFDHAAAAHGTAARTAAAPAAV